MESERQGMEGDKRKLAVIILLNGDEVGINTVCLCDVCVCARA